MASDFERKVSVDGLTLKLYRGEGAALLAFDLDPAKATRDFVGFSVEVRYPGSAKLAPCAIVCISTIRPTSRGRVRSNQRKPRSKNSAGSTFRRRLRAANFAIAFRQNI